MSMVLNLGYVYPWGYAEIQMEVLGVGEECSILIWVYTSYKRLRTPLDLCNTPLTTPPTSLTANLILKLISDSAWHMIIGGYQNPGPGSISSVELYNWKTWEQCQLKDLPEPVSCQSGTVMEGTPIICGNFEGSQDKCYSLNRTSNTWIKVLSIFFKVDVLNSKCNKVN
jgi:hypothetical protein